MAPFVDGDPHGNMGMPHTIVKGLLPSHCESCHGVLIFVQLVASTKSWAYLMEVGEPSHLAAASMPPGLDLPSEKPGPAASTGAALAAGCPPADQPVVAL